WAVRATGGRSDATSHFAISAPLRVRVSCNWLNCESSSSTNAMAGSANPVGEAMFNSFTRKSTRYSWLMAGNDMVFLFRWNVYKVAGSMFERLDFQTLKRHNPLPPLLRNRYRFFFLIIICNDNHFPF